MYYFLFSFVDEEVLLLMSSFVKSSTAQDGSKYAAIQSKVLKHALSYPQVKLILYTTCSLLDTENIEVVHTCVTNARQQEEEKKMKILASIMTVLNNKIKINFVK